MSWPTLPVASGNLTETQDADFVEWFAWHLGQIFILLSTPTVRSWRSQWVVRPAHHCFLWWRWWSDTLWVTLVRLWLHLLSCNLRTIVVEISLQFYRHMLVSAFIEFHIWCWESTCFFSFNVVVILQSSLVGAQAKQHPTSFTKPAVVVVVANAWLWALISMEEWGFYECRFFGRRKKWRWWDTVQYTERHCNAKLLLVLSLLLCSLFVILSPNWLYFALNIACWKLIIVNYAMYSVLMLNSWGHFSLLALIIYC